MAASARAAPARLVVLLWAAPALTGVMHLLGALQVFAGSTMRWQAAALLLLLLTATTAAAWDMSMTSLADKLGDAIVVKGIQQGSIQSKLPLVLNVWPFVNATMAGWAALNNASSSTPWLDAVERVRGCHNLQGIGMCAITAAATAATAAATPAAATAVS